MLTAFHIGTSHSVFLPVLNDAGGIHAVQAGIAAKQAVLIVTDFKC